MKNTPGKKVLWMVVEKTELELPVIVADSPKELAQKFGVKRDTVYKGIMKKNSKYKRVEVDSMDD